MSTKTSVRNDPSESSDYSSSYTDSSSYESSSEGDLLDNLNSLSADLINPLLNSYSSNSGGKGDESSSSYGSSFSTSETETESESSEEIVAKPIKKATVPVKSAPVKSAPIKQPPQNVVIKKGFVMPEHEPTEEELLELEAKLAANSKGNRFQKIMQSATPNPSPKPTVTATQPTSKPPPKEKPINNVKQPEPAPTQNQPVQTTTTTTATATPQTQTSQTPSWSRSDSKKSSDKGSLEKKSGKSFLGPSRSDKPKPSVFTDIEGDTFSLFRRMNEIREEKREAASKKEEKIEETKESTTTTEDVVCDGTEPLIREFAVKEEMNKEGMKKAKKFSVTAGKGAPKFQMEDFNYCAFPHNKNKNLGLFCVFDGHVGKNCAQALTKVFPQTFYKKFVAGKWDEKTDLTPLLKEVYLEVDDQLKEYLYEGSTSTTVIIWRNSKNSKRYLQCANLGDSTAFLIRGGKSQIISEDHKLSIASERQRISDLGVTLTPDQTRLCGLAVCRAFGDFFPKSENFGIVADPYVCPPIELTKTDTTMILASDGLWDIVPDGQKAYEIIKNIKSSTDAAKLLMKTAVPPKNNTCSDNVTICVVSLV